MQRDELGSLGQRRHFHLVVSKRLELGFF